VRRLENFGAFVEGSPGLDGLVHVSKMALDRRVAHPRQVVSVGDAVQVTVQTIDPAQRAPASMVEAARRDRDAGVVGAPGHRIDLGQMNEKRSLGTFADLLAASKKKE
jgi:small subunit ribosomal protein S1